MRIPLAEVRGSVVIRSSSSGNPVFFNGNAMKILSINNKENDETRLQKILSGEVVQISRISTSCCSIAFYVWRAYCFTKKYSCVSYASADFLDECGDGVFRIYPAFLLPVLIWGERWERILACSLSFIPLVNLFVFLMPIIEC